MTKQLYEEALADVKKVKQVAEDNAKRAIIEAVTPRIREFIDQALLQEHPDDGDGPFPPSAPSAELGDGETSGAAPQVAAGIATDIVAVDPGAHIPVGTTAGISAPDAEGKVTLDIDDLCSTQPGIPVPPPMFGAPVPKPEEAEYEISLESIEALKPVISTSKQSALSAKDLRIQIAELVKRVSRFRGASKVVQATPAFNEQISRLIGRVQDMYDHVQEQEADSARKCSYEALLETSFKALNQLQESITMSQKTNKGQMNEADVTLKLTGLPDDIDLDTVGVDLITGEEDEEGAEADMGDLDMGGDQDMQGGQQGGQQQMETRRLSDDTIVEIDEKMLRREIARMRNLREEHSATGGSETKAQSWGHGSGAGNILDDFGGGKDEGAAEDQEIVDLSPAPGARPLGEADGEQDDLDEGDDQDDLDEGDMQGMDELQLKRKEDEFGTEAANDHAVRAEGLKRLGFEKKLQERAKARAASLKKEASAARSKRNAKRFNECKKEYQVVARRFNESVARAKKMSKLVAEATKKLQESRSNSGTARSAGNQTENASLRKKLAETNLFNAKLLYTNRLLQNEQLTSRQKAQVIKQLDTAKTVREAKLVYESLASTLVGSSSKTVNENADRKVLGSNSRVSRPASTSQSLNEGYEAERWAQLAGINKK
jgi:hypothetical protein